MSYFNSIYPKIDYDPTGNGITTRVQDIFTRVIARESVLNRSLMFQKYTVRDGENPEILANDFYGNAKFYWVILLSNKLYDRYYEWPMTESMLRKYVSDKYANPNAIHHYEISQSSGDTNTKIKVELADEPTATPITNYEHEIELNNVRREIKILEPAYFSQFVSDYMELIKETTL